MQNTQIQPINIPTKPNKEHRPNTVRNQKRGGSVPNTQQRAQTARASIQRSAYQKALIQARLYAGCSFGKDAKKITIGIPRQEMRPAQAIPGPGSYNPPTQPISHRLRTMISDYYPEKDFTTLTSGIDYRSRSIFPEQLHTPKVGERLKYDYWTLPETPPPNYVNKRPFAEVPSHKIQDRRERKIVNDNPGPGAYDALQSYKTIHDSTRSTHLVMGNDRRGHWMVSEKNPSPADYSPNKNNVLVHEPSFTIGKKSRRSRRELSRRKNGLSSSDRQATIGVDVFLIKLDPSIDEQEARNYVRSHPDLKNVLHDVIQEILREKPIAPVGYMRDYFLEERKKMGLDDEEPSVDPLDYYRNMIADQK